MTATIWHNPRCSTSRRVLADLRAAGVEPEVVEYLATGWTEAGLRALLAEAGMTARQALRAKEPLAKDLGLTAEGVSEAALIAAMVAHPVLVERPFVRTAKGTALCRPPERLAGLLD
ncbi:arsenate reductase (glutaredoxin) [Rhodobacter sp. SGA-6-6]|uniref:arsenate reductase (glutaredoxin) n=1 Tax=Rhodobacter sp. SGA-6-6 TaxID=2710882 RepID=UPI0013EA1EB2|nr:arsenate reductase (glutaredoxin) [Rhodobacter sp. SGA-6-6]